MFSLGGGGPASLFKQAEAQDEESGFSMVAHAVRKAIEDAKPETPADPSIPDLIVKPKAKHVYTAAERKELGLD